mmetsp:Transcript_31849/g.83136  ORF Transcript_31849/g.83136 Transcript_31849/m.83136 type:complete len:154 (+) Transcript_31849:341-802(+)
METPTLIPQGEEPTADEVQLVHSLIERCLQLYMNKAEVVTALHSQARVDTNLTSKLWMELEKKNPSFFDAYKVGLRIKEQATAYNFLINQQRDAMAATGTRFPDPDTKEFAALKPFSTQLPADVSHLSTDTLILSPVAASSLRWREQAGAGQK